MKSSSRTIRITGVATDETIAQIRVDAQTDAVRTRTIETALTRLFSISSPSTETSSLSRPELGLSLATQRDLQTATVTYLTEKHKRCAFKNSLERHTKADKGAYVDDDFRGITVLYSGLANQKLDLE
jgi:hypothetical protein